MADLRDVNIRVPLGSYKSDRTEKQALEELALTKRRAGGLVKKVSDIHKIPYSFALAFTCVETGGQAIRSGDGLSYGMMQCNAATLDGVIKFAFKFGMTIEEFKYIYYSCKPAFTLRKGVELPPLNWPDLPLNPFSEEYIQEVYRRSKIMSQKVGAVLMYSNPNHILNTGGKHATPTNIYNIKMNKDPEFGVHIGCIFLYELITKSIVREAGVEYVRVDWLINGYNGGYFSRFNPWINKLQEKYSPDVWIAQPNLPKVTNSYVKRLVGKGGYLEYIKNGKFVIED